MFEEKDIEINEYTDPEEIDLSSFDIQDELNDKIWIGSKMNPYVRKHLLLIAKDCIEDLEIEGIPIEDIIVTGSIANYNWNQEYSDIDLHIIVDFEKIDDNTDLLKKYFDSFRKNWNRKHENLEILGFPVELYIQDVNERHKSTGEFSVLDNKWLITPDITNLQNDDLDDEYVKEHVSFFMNEIDDLVESYENAGSDDDVADILTKASDLFEKIKETRKSSLSTDDGSEMTEGNLIFKSLRRNGYMEKLINLRTECYDSLYSLDDDE